MKNKVSILFFIVFLLCSLGFPISIIFLDKIGFFRFAMNIYEQIKIFFQQPIFIDYQAFWILGFGFSIPALLLAIATFFLED